MKAYLLVFDSGQVAREIVLDKLDKLPNVRNWYAFFDNTLCLASDDDPRTLSRLIQADFPQLRFVITEVNPENRGGRLPRSIWDFLNNPAPADTSADA